MEGVEEVTIPQRKHFTEENGMKPDVHWCSTERTGCLRLCKFRSNAKYPFFSFTLYFFDLPFTNDFSKVKLFVFLFVYDYNLGQYKVK